MRTTRLILLGVAVILPGLLTCGDGNESDRVGIASECAKDADCPRVDGLQLTCLTMFKGGYCGLLGCTQDADCPLGAACISQGGATYCFRECLEKPECNANRSLANEANCVSSVVRVGVSQSKICVPPSGT